MTLSYSIPKSIYASLKINHIYMQIVVIYCKENRCLVHPRVEELVEANSWNSRPPLGTVTHRLWARGDICHLFVHFVNSSPPPVIMSHLSIRVPISTIPGVGRPEFFGGTNMDDERKGLLSSIPWEQDASATEAPVARGPSPTTWRTDPSENRAKSPEMERNIGPRGQHGNPSIQLGLRPISLWTSQVGELMVSSSYHPQLVWVGFLSPATGSGLTTTIIPGSPSFCKFVLANKKALCICRQASNATQGARYYTGS